MPLAFEGRVSTDEGRHIALPNAGRTLLVVFPRWVFSRMELVGLVEDVEESHGFPIRNMVYIVYIH